MQVLPNLEGLIMDFKHLSTINQGILSKKAILQLLIR